MKSAWNDGTAQGETKQSTTHAETNLYFFTSRYLNCKMILDNTFISPTSIFFYDLLFIFVTYSLHPNL